MAEDETKAAPGKPEFREIASVERDIFHPYVGQMLLPNDDTLLMRGGARSYRIYDDAERDPRVFSTLQKRKLALVAYPWVIDPASQSAADKEVAEFVTTNLKDITFSVSIMDLMDAILKGFSVGEIMWAVQGTEIVPTTIIARDQRRFRFDLERKLRLITFQNMLPGEELPERKFIVHRYGAKDGNPYGLGIGTRLYWLSFFKRQGLTFWLTFADKFGSPTTVGKYPAGSEPADQAKLKAALRSIAQETGIIIPEGMLIELLQPSGSNSTDTYESLQRYLDEQIAEVVLGETLSTNIGSVGSKAAADTHNGVRLELSAADGEMLAASLNPTLIQWIVEFNRPGAALPKLRFQVEAGEDLDARADRDTKIVQMGFEPSEKYINETYGGDGEWKKKAAPPPLPIGGPEAPPIDDAFAEGAARTPDTVDRFAEQLAGLASAPIGSMVGKIKALLDDAKSLEDFRDRLIEVYPTIKPAAFSDVMAAALMASDLAGRFEVKVRK